MSMSEREASAGVRIVPGRNGKAPCSRRDTRKLVSDDMRKYRNQMNAQGMAREYNTGG